MMKEKFKVLTILGSPHDKKSNTRTLVEDFVDDVASFGLDLTHEIVALGRKEVKPCKGCWACTRGKLCPIKDDLQEIKTKMVECDMLILASPVYTNQIAAQMKALFDRLFTWCHIYPLLGKYGLSVVTTGNEGHGETGEFLEKMLATYGTYSFGSVQSIGGFTPGFFPWREKAREKNKKLAQKVANTILKGKKPSMKPIQRHIYKVMKNKMNGIHAVNSMVYGVPNDQPNPSKFHLKILPVIFKRLKMDESQIKKWGDILAFELSWWRDRGWLRTKSLKQLQHMADTNDFDVRSRLLLDHEN
ncbi:flavodoxin family protein [Methanococcoides sp. SA1]|nr:flavodoxin family protein [Methanococcoides sp. SA1]